jgi:zinc transporter 1/2/3
LVQFSQKGAILKSIPKSDLPINDWNSTDFLLQVRPRLVFFYILIFAFVSPVGVAVGIGLSEIKHPDDVSNLENLATTILSGIAAGTLLYVTFFEVLQREREKEGNGILRLLCICAGYCAMVVMELANGHEHDDE